MRSKSTNYAGRILVVDKVRQLKENQVLRVQSLVSAQQNIESTKNADFLKTYSMMIEGGREVVGEITLTANIYRDGENQLLPEFVDGNNYTWKRSDDPESFGEIHGKTITVTSDDLISSPSVFTCVWKYEYDFTANIGVQFELSYGTIRQYAWSNALTEAELTDVPPSSWSDKKQDQPEDKKYLWRRESADNGKSWTYFRETGEIGTSGWSTTTVQIFKRSETTPERFDGGTLAYTFSTATLSGDFGTWSKTIPTGEGDVYTCFATALSQSDTYDIAPTKWSDPAKISTEGNDGQPGLNVANIQLFQRSENQPTVPDDTVTYNFETHTVSNTGSWSNTIPSGTLPLWTTLATASSRSTSDIINPSEWSTPVIYAKNGEDGVGIQSITYYYGKSASQTQQPESWSTTLPVLDSEYKYLWSYNVTLFTDGSSDESEKGIIGNFSVDGDAGNGIQSITYYYQVSASNSIPPSTWIEVVPELTTTNKYLWSYYEIEYTNGDTVTSTKSVVGVYGDKGDPGTDAQLLTIASDLPAFHIQADGTPYPDEVATVTVTKQGIEEDTVWEVPNHIIPDNTVEKKFTAYDMGWGLPIRFTNIANNMFQTNAELIEGITWRYSGISSDSSSVSDKILTVTEALPTISSTIYINNIAGLMFSTDKKELAFNGIIWQSEYSDIAKADETYLNVFLQISYDTEDGVRKYFSKRGKTFTSSQNNDFLGKQLQYIPPITGEELPNDIYNYFSITLEVRYENVTSPLSFTQKNCQILLNVGDLEKMFPHFASLSINDKCTLLESLPYAEPGEDVVIGGTLVNNVPAPYEWTKDVIDTIEQIGSETKVVLNVIYKRIYYDKTYDTTHLYYLRAKLRSESADCKFRINIAPANNISLGFNHGVVLSGIGEIEQSRIDYPQKYNSTNPQLILMNAQTTGIESEVYISNEVLAPDLTASGWHTMFLLLGFTSLTEIQAWMDANVPYFSGEMDFPKLKALPVSVSAGTHFASTSIGYVQDGEQGIPGNDGAPGADAKLLNLTTDNNVFRLKSDGTPYDNQKAIVTVNKQGISEDTTFVASNGMPIADNSTEITITPEMMGLGLPIRFTNIANNMFKIYAELTEGVTWIYIGIKTDNYNVQDDVLTVIEALPESSYSYINSIASIKFDSDKANLLLNGIVWQSEYSDVIKADGTYLNVFIEAYYINKNGQSVVLRKYGKSFSDFSGKQLQYIPPFELPSDFASWSYYSYLMVRYEKVTSPLSFKQEKCQILLNVGDLEKMFPYFASLSINDKCTLLESLPYAEPGQDVVIGGTLVNDFNFSGLSKQGYYSEQSDSVKYSDGILTLDFSNLPQDYANRSRLFFTRSYHDSVTFSSLYIKINEKKVGGEFYRLQGIDSASFLAGQNNPYLISKVDTSYNKVSLLQKDKPTTLYNDYDFADINMATYSNNFVGTNFEIKEISFINLTTSGWYTLFKLMGFSDTDIYNWLDANLPYFEDTYDFPSYDTLQITAQAGSYSDAVTIGSVKDGEQGTAAKDFSIVSSVDSYTMSSRSYVIKQQTVVFACNKINLDESIISEWELTVKAGSLITLSATSGNSVTVTIPVGVDETSFKISCTLEGLGTRDITINGIPAGEPKGVYCGMFPQGDQDKPTFTEQGPLITGDFYVDSTTMITYRYHQESDSWLVADNTMDDFGYIMSTVAPDIFSSGKIDNVVAIGQFAFYENVIANFISTQKIELYGKGIISSQGYNKGDWEKDTANTGFYGDSSGHFEATDMKAKRFTAIDAEIIGLIDSDVLTTKNLIPNITYESVKTEYQQYWKNATTQKKDFNQIDWNNTKSNISTINKIIFDSNKFVAVGGGESHISISTNAYDWTDLSENLAISELIPLSGIAYGNGIYVVVGGYISIDGHVPVAYYSTNLIDWTQININNQVILNDITYSNGKFVIACTKGTILYSENALSWTAVSISEISDIALNKVKYLNDKFIAVGNSGKIAYSNDAVSWSVINNQSITNDINDIEYGNDKFIIVGSNGYAAYSTDGLSWVDIEDTTLQETSIFSIVFAENKFIIGGGYSRTAYSADGLSWININNYEITDTIWCLAFGNNTFVAGCSNNSISLHYNYIYDFTLISNFFSQIIPKMKDDQIKPSTEPLMFQSSVSGSFNNKDGSIIQLKTMKSIPTELILGSDDINLTFNSNNPLFWNLVIQNLVIDDIPATAEIGNTFPKEIGETNIGSKERRFKEICSKLVDSESINAVDINGNVNSQGTTNTVWGAVAN